jgi:hypothetical protein
VISLLTLTKISETVATSPPPASQPTAGTSPQLSVRRPDRGVVAA